MTSTAAQCPLPAAWATPTLVSTRQTVQLAQDVREVLALRRARIPAKGAARGKRGLLVEGPSGRGKDVVVDGVLKTQGFVEVEVCYTDVNRQQSCVMRQPPLRALRLCSVGSCPVLRARYANPAGNGV